MKCLDNDSPIKHINIDIKKINLIRLAEQIFCGRNNTHIGGFFLLKKY